MFSRRFLALLALGAALPAAAQNAPAPAAGPRRSPAPRRRPVARRSSPPTGRARTPRQLLAYVEGIGAEGLDPADYNPGALRDAVETEGRRRSSAVATSTFLRVAADLKFGHVRGDGRIDWHVKDDSWNVYDQQALLDRAVKGDVAETLDVAASDPSAICGAQGAARRSSRPTPRPATGSGSTSTAGAGCRATSAPNM